MIKEYTIAVGDTDNILHSTDTKECYKFMLDNRDELVKDNTNPDEEPLDYILGAITELIIYHDDLVKPIKLTDQENHALDIISALSGALTDNENRKLIKDVIIEQLYKLPDVLSDSAIDYILLQLDEIENLHIFYSFQEIKF